MTWTFFTPGPSLASYATTLPASPTDGQEAVLVDSITVPTYQWRFRYNAGSASSYKWEFVGGSPKTVPVSTAETTTSTSNVDLTTVQSFTLPRAGDYLYTCCAVGSNGTAGNNFFLLLEVGGAEKWGAYCALPTTAGLTATLAFTFAVTGSAASDVAKQRYRVSGGTGQWQYRNFTIQPIRVS